ncbi:UDP-glucose 4-epimerase family protein [Pseudomonas cremoricolorata]|uniref:UDP-glucose 4-epimerase family protein n=1 Tax=Pseudomonas cremoricolorata TaxID=157783 RepID=UPI00048BFA7E|nr:SDR family oxidoreductase [Pseudomonas cremoricolorata]
MSAVVLVTGANGFIGSALMERLRADTSYTAVGLVRKRPVCPGENLRYEVVEDYMAACPAALLQAADTVIHLASRVHVMRETDSDPLAEYRRINVEGTLQLARAAAAAGVRRFIFVSSIKVNGEGTDDRAAYRASDRPHPTDPYGVSKLEAEVALLALARETSMECVVVRPVLVYGPGVKANFQTMMKWLRRGVPLPFGAIDNKRSLVALDNLTDLLVTCIAHPRAANRVLLVSDGEDLSTTELLRRLGKVLGKPARLLPFPTGLMYALARGRNASALAKRLCGSLQVDISETRELLDWNPPVSVDAALQATAQHFLKGSER